MSRIFFLSLALLTLAGCAAIEGDAKPKLQVPTLTDAQRSELLSDAETDLTAKSYDDARVKFGRVLASQPANAHARIGLAEVSLATGNIEQANAAFHSLVGEKSVRNRALQGEGLTLLLMRDRVKAAESLKAAVREDPSLWRAWNALGEIYDSKHKWADAARCYQKALKVNHRSEIVYNNIGVSEMMQGQYAKAEQAFTTALKIQRNFKEAENNLRIALAWQGKYEEAKAGASNKDLPNVLNNIGYIAILRHDYDRAEAFLSQAMDASPAFFERAWENLQYLHSLQASAETPKKVSQ